MVQKLPAVKVESTKKVRGSKDSLLRRTFILYFQRSSETLYASFESPNQRLIGFRKNKGVAVLLPFGTPF